MKEDLRSLANAYLDGVLTDLQEAELNAKLKNSLENIVEFADIVRLHHHFHNVMQSQSVHLSKEQGILRANIKFSGPRVWHRSGFVGGLVALAAMVFLGLWLTQTPQVSAATEFDRLIENASYHGDRTYIIHNKGADTVMLEERRAPIDGAMLYVRQPDQYVLVRKFPNGQQFVTGSNGERSWSIPPTGAVRVSGDPLRFRGPVPGHQQGIPFADLRSDLVKLRDAYIVSPFNAEEKGTRGILVIKKFTRYRGPNRVELWYESQTGIVTEWYLAVCREREVAQIAFHWNCRSARILARTFLSILHTIPRIDT